MNKPKLREIRESLGLSQQKFGDAVGITKMAVSHIENGFRGLSGDLALRIQDFLKSQGMTVSIDELYEGLKSSSYKNKGRFSSEYKRIQEVYEPDPDNPIPTFLGWLIKDGNNIFAIGDISIEEISKLAGKKPVNVIKCRDYELENWNVEED
jgi:transcriptional regulator with XRE-family HTH domain